MRTIVRTLAVHCLHGKHTPPNAFVSKVNSVQTNPSQNRPPVTPPRVAHPCRIPYADPMTAKASLHARLKALDAEDAAGQDAQKTVELDQQAVGRLSRMDALQNQAMAQAQARRRVAERQRIIAALARLDAGDYGYCTDCGEDIAPARLAADPSIALCVACMQGR